MQPRSLGGDAESSSTILPAPSHHQPLAPKLRPTLSSDRPLSPPPPPPPLTRYLRDVQTHELIALGIRVDDIQYLDPGTPPQPPTYPHVHGAARNRVATSSMSSVCLNVSEKQGSQKSTAAEGAESSPAGELPDVIKSSGSEQDEDGTTSDEHLENLHRACVVPPFSLSLSLSFFHHLTPFFHILTLHPIHSSTFLPRGESQYLVLNQYHLSLGGLSAYHCRC